MNLLFYDFVDFKVVKDNEYYKWLGWGELKYFLWKKFCLHQFHALDFATFFERITCVPNSLFPKLKGVPEARQ